MRDDGGDGGGGVGGSNDGDGGNGSDGGGGFTMVVGWCDRLVDRSVGWYR